MTLGLRRNYDDDDARAALIDDTLEKKNPSMDEMTCVMRKVGSLEKGVAATPFDLHDLPLKEKRVRARK